MEYFPIHKVSTKFSKDARIIYSHFKGESSSASSHSFPPDLLSLPVPRLYKVQTRIVYMLNINPSRLPACIPANSTISIIVSK